jgi:biotin carboxyl carrier protein
MYEVSVMESGGNVKVALDGEVLGIDMVPVAAEVYSLLVDGRSYELQVRGRGGNYQVFYESRHYDVTVEGDRARLMRSLTATVQTQEKTREIKATMPGLVVKVEVREGDEVKPGDGLVVVEAMKMENEIRAQRKGVIRHIFIKEGMTVDQGQTLVVME